MEKLTYKTVIKKVNELKSYEFNDKLFDVLRSPIHAALKDDMKKSGQKVEVHILPDDTVVCGNQRLKLAQQLGLETLRCTVVTGLETEKDIKEYAINDNLLRRQLTREQEALLIAELSKKYETGSGTRTDLQPGVIVTPGLRNTVLEKTAKEINKSPDTVKNSRRYAKLLEDKPTEYPIKADKDGYIKLPTMTHVFRKEREKKLKSGDWSLPVGKFNVIYADPPWSYGFSMSDRGDPKKQYPTMELDDIKNLKDSNGKSIQDVLEDDAILFLWTTAPKLPEGLQVLKAWDFEYKTAMFWDKKHIGTGYYCRSQVEILLIGKRGKMPVPAESDRPPALYSEQRTVHSAKPAMFYELIEKMYPKGTYLEILFLAEIAS